MELERFSAEATHLFSQIYGESTWFAWISAGSETRFIDSGNNRICNTEERFFLLQQVQTFASEPFSLPDNHSFYRFSGTEPNSKPTFQFIDLNEIQVLIAVSTDKSALLSLSLSLLKEKLNDWQWRIQAGELIERQQQQIVVLEQKLQTTQSSSHQRMTRLLTQWKRMQTVEIVFPPDFYNALDASLTESELIQQLDSALQLARFTQPASTVISLNPTHLSPKTPLPIAESPRILSPNQRAVLILDKYEAAARMAQHSGLIVNGKTIAAHIQPSISPPAITDALKKHRKGIALALEEYPEKWGLLRKYLKPVKELNEHSFFGRTTISGKNEIE
ncbi:MAG: hypothetical protein QE487_13655 [Fluviicola sp.]|nr:hypothetical protein [Fluviicola sp.]